MRGEFLPGRFSTLGDDQLTFIRVFLRARGNLSEMERILGISYPTIRNKLEEINAAFEAAEAPAAVPERAGPAPGPTGPGGEVPQGNSAKGGGGPISAAEALQKLQELGEGKK